jgi:flagellar motor switch protein FliM
MRVEPYNFASPQFLRHGAREQILSWLRAASALAQKTWPRHLLAAAEWRVERIDSLPIARALAELPESGLGYRVRIGGELDSLMVLPRPLLLLLVAALMGDTADQMPDDRELTPVEDSLADFALRRLFLDPLQESWPGAEPLPLEVAGREPQPRWRRSFAGEEHLAVCASAVQGPFGRLDWRWLLPQAGVRQLFDGHGETDAAEGESDVRLRLEASVRAVPVTFSVTLGSAEVPFAQLAGLKVGDVIVLDQRIGDTLAAEVAGERKYVGWPGRVGPRQAFVIDGPNG